MLENQDAIVAVHEGLPLYVELPASVELTVEYTEPGLQGDRSSGGTKPARLETGYEIQVPLFLTTGEKVKVDTRTGDYLGRVARRDPLRAHGAQGPQAGARHAVRVGAARAVAGRRHAGRPGGRRPAGERVHRGAGRGGRRNTPSEIDELLETHSEGWTLDRMPAVDRNILRIGAYELLYDDEVPDVVAISEAVALARDLSTDESPTFVNGLLARSAWSSSRPC